jgi:hypothetical protein
MGEQMTHPFHIIEHVDVERERAELLRRLAALKLEAQVNPSHETFTEAEIVMERLQRLTRVERSA